LVFLARFLFAPVHLVKRKGRLKPATIPQFFFVIASGYAVKIRRWW